MLASSIQGLGMAGVGPGNQLRSRSQAPQSMKEAKQPESTQGAVDKKEPSKMNRSGEMVAFFCFLGIFISYFVYGLLQEKM